MTKRIRQWLARRRVYQRVQRVAWTRAQARTVGYMEGYAAGFARGSSATLAAIQTQRQQAITHYTDTGLKV